MDGSSQSIKWEKNVMKPEFIFMAGIILHELFNIVSAIVLAKNLYMYVFSLKWLT